MGRRTALDRLVYQFQHRWETAPQFRAAVSGVVGLTLILMMCACMGVVSTAANAALAGFGAGSTNAVIGSADTGTGQLAANKTFPTATPPTQAAGVLIGGTTIPNSKTPAPSPTDQPTPTATPTATPCLANCGGGGGGGGGGGVGSGTVSGSASPTPWLHGQTGYIHVHTSAPNVGYAIIINYCSSGCGYTYEPAGQTDASGNDTFTVPDLIPNIPGTAKITIMANFSPIAYADIYQAVK